jgi:hypothetical protein
VPVNTILTAFHASWSNDLKPGRYPVQRKFQWLRNGIPIDNAVGTAYTTQPGDIGTAISLKENAWYINQTNPGIMVEIPIVTAQAVSSSIVVTGSPDAELVYQDNLTYVGSFRLTSPPVSDGHQSIAYGGHGLTINPNGYNGQRTMLSVGHPSLSYAGEISIPALGRNTDPAQLPASTLVRPATNLIDPTEGQLFSSGIAGGTSPESLGLQIIPGSDKMLVTGLNWYSQNTYDVFWRRPADLTVLNQVEGPFIIIDPGSQENPRWTAGWMCNIPAAYQTDLGGNMLASLSGLSIRSSASNGPSAIAFDTADIDSALATQHKGVAQGGTDRTITLAADASATTGTYVGQYIYVPSAATEPRIITDYDGTTKRATIAPVAGGQYWDISVPVSGFSYKTTPVVAGTQLVGYSLENAIQAPAVFNQIWNASAPRGMCIPNGTRSLLFFGSHGEGPNSYGTAGQTTGDALNFKIYDPDSGYDKGYHAYPYTTKIWAYDINDLVLVKNGSKTYDQIQPYAVWSAVLPGKDSYTSAAVQGATYDPSTRRVYISQRVVDNYQGSGNYGSVIVHAFEVTNAVAAPGITTTSLPPLVAGSSYTAILTATGATPITWSIVEGSLPVGLTLNTSTGYITGTPATDAVVTIKVRATNQIGFEEKSLSSGQTLSGISVEVAKVTNGVAGSFQSLGSLVQMTTWVDGSYSQDFWRSSTVIDDTIFVITREQNTDRAEVWAYRPPANSFKPANSSAFDYSWNTVTSADVENDLTYDIRISINGSLVTPQYSSSTTTRVLCAPGTIRRLATAFKLWIWSRVDAAVSAYRLPSYNVNSLSELVVAQSLPNAASTLGSKPQEAFNHAALGGPTSSVWFDGNHSPSAGGSQAGRSLSQSYEAMAISDRVNNISANLSDLENVLRKSAEYSGTFPQYTFLDPETLRPYDAQKGSKPWSVMSAAYNCAGSTYVPMRTGFNWDTAHHYNNGHVAFEATRDPFYALLLQCNAMAALAEPSSAVRTGETKRFNPAHPIDNNGAVICPLPKYVISVDQERSRWWSLAAITKAKLATDLCPPVDFLQPLAMWNTVLDDGADMLYHYISEIDAVTAAPARVTNAAESLQAQRYAQKTLSAYDQLFSDYETGINQSPVTPVINNIANTMSLSLPTGTATSYPYQFGRVFKQGVIANYPQVLIDGVPQTTQADVKNRWPDGSVKFAILSLVVSSLNTAQSTLTFQNQSTVNSTPETKANMLANYDFDCIIDATSGGIPISGAPVSARAILTAISDATLASNTSSDSPNSRYWTQGPICTTVILCDHTTKAYDFGTNSTYKSLRPIFHVQFWPSLNKYKVRVIVEGSDVTKLQDEIYDVSLSIGNSSPTTVYTKTSIPQSCGTRWTKVFWSGTAPSVINVDHNANYLANVKVIPYYDPLAKPSPASISSDYATWSGVAKDIYDPGYYTKLQQAPGGRSEIAIINQWSTDSLLAADYRTDEINDAHAALAMAWPMHLREGASSKLYDLAQTLSAIGCPVSLFARPTIQMGDGNQYITGYLYGYWNASPADAYTWIAWGAPAAPGTHQTPGASPTNNNGWSPFSDHVPQPFYASYITSGDYVWLEQMQFWASWGAFDAGLNTNSGFYGRGPSLTNAGLPGDTRRQGWIFRNRVAAAAFSVDGSKEQTYYNYLVNDAITISEGIRGITGSGNESSSSYIWGTTVGRNDQYGGLGIHPLHFWEVNIVGSQSYATQYQYLWNEPVDRAQSTWQNAYNVIAFAFARDLGFDTTRILNWYATAWNTAFSSDSTAWLLGNFVVPAVTATPLQNIPNWPSTFSKFKPLSLIVAEGHPLSPYMPQDPASYTYGYPEYYTKLWNNSPDSPPAYVAAALAMIHDISGVSSSWNWVSANWISARVNQPASRWRILPRP